MLVSSESLRWNACALSVVSSAGSVTRVKLVKVTVWTEGGEIN